MGGMLHGCFVFEQLLIVGLWSPRTHIVEDELSSGEVVFVLSRRMKLLSDLSMGIDSARGRQLVSVSQTLLDYEV
jgi:hypothetical protein